MLQISFRELKPQSSTDVERRRDQRKKHKVSQYIPFLNQLVTEAFLVCTYQIRLKHSQSVFNSFPVLFQMRKLVRVVTKNLFLIFTTANINFFKTNVHALDNLRLFNFAVIFLNVIVINCINPVLSLIEFLFILLVFQS